MYTYTDRRENDGKIARESKCNALVLISLYDLSVQRTGNRAGNIESVWRAETGSFQV